MPKSILFWIVMLLWLLLGVGYMTDALADSGWVDGGLNLLPFIAVSLLGVELFGKAIK